MAHSKSKGSAWERDAAESLTKIFGRNFKRNITGSGAHFGGGNAARKLKGYDTSQILSHLGDISPPTGFYVVTECKNYNEYPFNNLLNGSPTIAWDFIKEIRHDARLGGWDGYNDAGEEDERVFFPHWLCMKVTRKGSYMFLPHQFFGHLISEGIYQGPYFKFIYYRKRKGTEDVYYTEPYYMIPWTEIAGLSDHIKEVITDPKYFFDEISDAVSP